VRSVLKGVPVTVGRSVAAAPAGRGGGQSARSTANPALRRVQDGMLVAHDLLDLFKAQTATECKLSCSAPIRRVANRKTSRRRTGLHLSLAPPLLLALLFRREATAAEPFPCSQRKLRLLDSVSRAKEAAGLQHGRRFWRVSTSLTVKEAVALDDPFPDFLSVLRTSNETRRKCVAVARRLWTTHLQGSRLPAFERRSLLSRRFPPLVL
jgi:hypothetical protein